MSEPEPQQVQTLSGMSQDDSPAEARITLPFSSARQRALKKTRLNPARACPCTRLVRNE